MIPPSTPIAETLAALGMPDTPMPTHVRTAHDLMHAITHGEVKVPIDVVIALGLPVDEVVALGLPVDEDKWHEGMADE